MSFNVLETDRRMDNHLALEREKREYPYILIKDIHPDIGYLLRDLKSDEGMKVALYQGGVENVTVIRLRRSIMILATLANIQRFILCVSKDKNYEINGVDDLLALDDFEWRDA